MTPSRRASCWSCSEATTWKRRSQTSTASLRTTSRRFDATESRADRQRGTDRRRKKPEGSPKSPSSDRAIESLQEAARAAAAASRKMLKVRSPIDGRVVTWNVDERLLGRPVNRGEELLEIADPNQRLGARSTMPEYRMGHIAKAAKASAGQAAGDVFPGHEPQAAIARQGRRNSPQRRGPRRRWQHGAGSRVVRSAGAARRDRRSRRSARPRRPKSIAASGPSATSGSTTWSISSGPRSCSDCFDQNAEPCSNDGNMAMEIN